MQNTQTNEIFSLNPIVNVNDYKTTLINVDSSFRNTYQQSSTNFYFDLPTTVRNVIKIRLASFEIPNVWYEFTLLKKNTYFTITAPDISQNQQSMYVIIPDGNYTANQLINIIQIQLNTFKSTLGIYFLISLDPYTLKTTIIFQGTVVPSGSPPALPTNPPSGPFTLDFSTPVSKVLNVDWGLGYILGFRKTNYICSTQQGGVYLQTSEGILDSISGAYIFLIVNDFYSVVQKTEENYFDATAKIIVRQDKGQLIYDDGSDLVGNQVTLPAPIDLSVLKVQLVDFFGNIIDLNNLNFSFTIEITQVQNSKLREFYRNYTWDGPDPKISKDSRGSAVSGYQALHYN